MSLADDLRMRTARAYASAQMRMSAGDAEQVINPFPNAVPNSLIFQFRALWPEFNTVPDADIATALAVSAMWVDPSIWDPMDYPMAILLWAAHFQTLKQMQQASAQLAGGAGYADIYLRSISFGERHVAFNERRSSSFAEKSLGPGEQLLLDTIYGTMYITLRNRNVIPIAIV